MTAAWQSFAATSAGLGTDLVVTKPSGTVDGDLLIAVGKASGADTITAPAGWTVHSASLGSNLPLWTKIASSEPANYTFVVTGTANSVVVIARVNGQHASTPVDVASGVSVAGGTANHVIPSVTPTGANRLLLQICARLTNTSYTPPGTATERWDNQAPTGLLSNAGGDEIVGAGATGTRTWASASSSGGAVGYMLAINPGSQTLSVTGFTPTVDFGTPSLKQFVNPSGFTPAVVFGAPSLVQDQFLPVTGFTPVVVFGSPVLLSEVNPDGFTVSVVFGTPSLGQGVQVDGFAVAVLFGDATVILDNVLSVTGFTPTIVFGSPDVDRQPFVTATVYDHETGNPVGAGATVQLFDENGTLLDTTTTDAGGDYIFFLPFGFTDQVFTVVRTTVGLTDYQGVSEICAVST